MALGIVSTVRNEKSLKQEITVLMKHKTCYIIALLLIALFMQVSCRVASLQQFYCKKDVIPISERVLGKWKNNEFNLAFHKDHAVISSVQHPEIKPTKLITVFFKIDNTLFMDAYLNSEIELPGGYFVIPCHTLFKIDFKDNEFKATPFNYEWICEQVKQGKIEIPNVIMKNPQSDNDFAYVFTGSSEQWKTVLEKCASNPEAFKYPQEFNRIVDKN